MGKTPLIESVALYYLTPIHTDGPINEDEVHEWNSVPRQVF
jgi:hypothetical protein